MSNEARFAARTRAEFIADTAELVLAALVRSDGPNVFSAATRTDVLTRSTRLAVRSGEALWDAMVRRPFGPTVDPLRATAAMRCLGELLAFQPGVAGRHGDDLAAILGQSIIAAVIAADMLVTELAGFWND